MANVAKLKKLGVLSVAKLEAVLMAVLGLIFGIIYAIILMGFGAVFGQITGSVDTSSFLYLGLLLIVVCPIIFGFLGFIGGAVSAFMYNLLAGFVGGIEMEFDVN